MILQIKVNPGSSKDKIVFFKEPNFLEINLKAKPEKNKANESLCQFLGKLFKVPKEQVKILKGKTTKNKLVKIEELTEKEVLESIKKALEKS